MRLLKVKVDGAELFKNCLFELDFIATDRVPRDDEGTSLTSRPFARSLPSTRKMLSAWLALMRRARPPRSISSALFWAICQAPISCVDLRPKMTTGGEWHSPVYLVRVLREDSFYLIESELALIDADSTGTAPIGERGFDSYAFANEQLWKYSSAQISRKTILDIDAFRDKSTLLMRRNGPTNDPTVLDEAKKNVPWR